MSSLSFGNVLLEANGKKGVLKPMDDGSGYYMINAGRIGGPNRNGITYTPNAYIRSQMSDDSDLGRRLKRGEVYSELGHPPQYYLENINGQIVRRKITDTAEWIMRLRTILMENVCGHIRRIHWDFPSTGNAPIDMRIEIIPFGTYKDILQQSFDTPDVNTSFSMRTVTKFQQRGDITREIEYFTGVDFVPEAGMEKATKHHTAGCESFLDSGPGNFDEEFIIRRDELIDYCEHHIALASTKARFAGTESLDAMRNTLEDIKRTMHTGPKRFNVVRSSALSLF